MKKYFLFLFFLILVSLSTSVLAAEKMYENWTSGDDGGYGVSSAQYVAQTFCIGATSTNESFYLTQIAAKLWVADKVGNVAIGIYNLTANSVGGLPSSVHFVSNSTFNYTGLPTDPGTFVNITMPTYYMEAGKCYALVMNGTNVGAQVRWRHKSGGGYNAGNKTYWDGSWKAETADNLFVIYGDASPIVPGTNVTINFPTATTYNYNLSSLNYTYTTSGTCRYSRNGGTTNSSDVAAGTNFTLVTAINGSNTWTLWCNDTPTSFNVSSVTFTKLIMNYTSWSSNKFNNSQTSETLNLATNQTRWISWYNSLTGLSSVFINLTGVTSTFNMSLYTSTASSGGSPYRVTYRNGVAALSTADGGSGNAIDLYNVTNSTPYIMSSITGSWLHYVADGARMSADGTKLYGIAENNNEEPYILFGIINITNYSAPTSINTTIRLGEGYTGVRGIFLLNNDLIFVVGHHHFSIWNVTNAFAPQLLVQKKSSTIPHIGGARAVYVVGNIMYIAGDSSGLSIFDVSDLTNPTELGYYEDTIMRDVYVYNFTAYTITMGGTLRSINVSNPASPTLLDFKATGFTSGRNVVGDGRYLFASDEGTGKVIAYDISNPSSLSKIQEYSDQSYVKGAAGIDLNSNKLYVAAGGNTKLTILNTFSAGTPNVTISINGNRLYSINSVENATTPNLASSINPFVAPYLDGNNYTIPITFSGQGSVTYSGLYFAAGEDTGGTSGVTYVTIDSPIPLGDYYSTSVSLKFSATNTNGISSCWYTLNAGITNTSLSSCANTTITANTGSNTLKVYAKSPLNEEGSDSVTFNVNIFSLNLVTPTSTRYNQTNMSLNYSVNTGGTIDACWYTLNSGTTNFTLTGCYNTTFTGVVGSNTLRLYGNTTEGLSSLTSVTFTIGDLVANTSLSDFCSAVTSGQDNFFPTLMIILGVIGIGIMVMLLFVAVQAANGANISIDINEIFETFPLRMVLLAILGITMLVWLFLTIMGSLCLV